jgi:hypothetical protein
VQQAYSPEEWELATLVLTRPSYQIKFKHTGEVIIDEKYSPNLQVYFPCDIGHFSNYEFTVTI